MNKRNYKILSFILIFLFLITSFNNNFSYAKVEYDKLNEVIKDTGNYLYKNVPNPGVGSIGGEWAVIGLARSNIDVPDNYYQQYYKNVENHVKSLDGNLHKLKYTEYSRIILALSSIGKDPRDVAGYDLTKALGDYDKTIYQGINGPIWALIALDSLEYEIPDNNEAKIKATRQMYIDRILESQLPDGGWSLFGNTESGKEEKSDPDITAMALQALAKYKDNEKVNKSIDKAILALSKMQNDSGGFSSWNAENSESCAQVIVALNELGISLDDQRFIKNNNTLLDNLLSYYNKGEGFKHTKDGSGSNQMATEQAFYACVSAKRAIDGENSLYRMTDVKRNINSDTKTIEVGLEGKLKDIKFMPVVNKNVKFNDIENSKSKKAIEVLSSKNIINGKSDNIFEPDSTMTRAEFATIVVKSLGLDLQKEKIFKDVNEKDWFFDYISTANNYGIIKGKSKDIFDPQGLITKEEAAVMMKRASNLAGLELELNETATRDILAQFSDYMNISKWARESTAYCYSNEILDTNDLKVNLHKNVTRGEIAQMIFNMLDKVNLL